MVKLYDLSTLCADIVEMPHVNPFTEPVAILMYRMARKMRDIKDMKYKHRTIRTLLEKALGLLSSHKHPQVVTSSHFLLSDIYVPSETEEAEEELSETEGVEKKKEENTPSQVGFVESVR